MAKTDVKLRAGAGSPTDVNLYPLGSDSVVYANVYLKSLTGTSDVQLSTFAASGNVNAQLNQTLGSVVVTALASIAGLPAYFEGDRYASKLKNTSNVLSYDINGALGWRDNMPVPGNDAWDINQFGATPTDAFQSSLSGTGAQIISTVKSDSRYPFLGQIDTGTLSTGRATLAAGITTTGGTIQISPSSGINIFETVLQVTALSNGTDTYTLIAGMSNVQTSSNPTQGGWIVGNSNANANFQCTVRNPTTTNTDSGVAIVANTAYRIRIVATNNTKFEFYILTDSAYYANNRNYGSPVVTITTNTPNNAGGIHATIGMYKSAGTTNVSCLFNFVRSYRTPVRAALGQASMSNMGSELSPADGVGVSGYKGQKLSIDKNGRPVFVDWQQDMDNIPWQVVDNGMLTGAMATYVNGAGTSVIRAAVAGFPQCQQLQTGTTSGGVAARIIADSNGFTPQGIYFDQNVDILYYEILFTIPTLSTSVQQHTFQAGYIERADSNPTLGAWFEINSNLLTHIKFVTGDGNGNFTTIDSSVNVIAGTWYFGRIIMFGPHVQATDPYLSDAGGDFDSPLVMFDIAPLGSDPSGSRQFVKKNTCYKQNVVKPGARFAKSSGTTNIQMNIAHQMAYHRAVTAGKFIGN